MAHIDSQTLEPADLFDTDPPPFKRTLIIANPQSQKATVVPAYSHVSLCEFLSMYACMHVCIYLRTYVCTYVCMHACIYVYVHVCVGVCACTL